MKKRFAVPTIDQKLCAHFGHCEKFAIVDTEDSQVTGVSFMDPPIHQPGTYPRFLAEQGVSTIISGGMGIKAQDIFRANNIEVYMGIDSDVPHKLVEAYLNNQLQAGENLCDH